MEVIEGESVLIEGRSSQLVAIALCLLPLKQGSKPPAVLQAAG